MDTQHWRQRQIEAAQELAGQGSEALRGGRFDIAEGALGEAKIILDMTGESDDDILKLRAQLFNELGFVRQKQERFEDALKLHQDAVDMCEGLVARGVEFRGNTAATSINLAGMLAHTGDFEKAKTVNLRAVELAEELLSDDPQARNLAFGAHQNLAVIGGRSKDVELAHSEMTRAVEVIEPADEEEQKRIAPQVAQGAQQVSVLMFNEERFDLALVWGRVAETYSVKAYEAHGDPVLPVYVTSQINLISFMEKEFDYAGAEDALFKALDVVGNHPHILERGLAFYELARKQSDARLAKGNLPREEVEDSYQDILKRIATIKEAAQEAGGNTAS